MRPTMEQNIGEKEKRCKRLMTELQKGVIKKEVLLNSSYRFSGEVAADYFSQTGIFLRSSLSKMIMHNHKDCSEIGILSQFGRG